MADDLSSFIKYIIEMSEIVNTNDIVINKFFFASKLINMFALKV